ncbi:DUF427 domain-containing protein [Phytohabitans rumicis]|uniref:DUF427 domain-containing protein n=1 Tax=Phytohabitans rumicis TaxID=1076125 RepID=A0A6V8L0Q7_9ACTN|nr:DUF427 domain-containing protein [Phytohabitans rumicis]GFJ88361.1 hypothetical protein Prum_020030 [Phytohabitans rumicis]
MTSQTAARGRVRVETGAKRVRIVFNGQVIADTTSPVYVWESPHYPTYYIPLADVRDGVLTATERTSHSPSRGDGQRYTVAVDGKEAVDAALRYPESPIEELRDLVRFEWDAMDDWFEEDEPVYVHARSPYTRIDILASSRHVRVEIDGVTVAESTRPYLLFETGLPTRYYLPMTDVRLDLLERSDTVTHCPYKGQAEYWSVRVGDTVHKDVVWSYRTPLPESQKVAGLLAFWPEKPAVTLHVS